jgi:hypothetical protein
MPFEKEIPRLSIWPAIVLILVLACAAGGFLAIAMAD